MRDWNLGITDDVQLVKVGLEPTYEGLELFKSATEIYDTTSVWSLPMRDWNGLSKTVSSIFVAVWSLPMRDWNFLRISLP